MGTTHQRANVTTLLKFLNERELSEAIGISVKTLQRWRLFKKGPVYRKLGGAVRYASDDVQAWISSRSIGGEAA